MIPKELYIESFNFKSLNLENKIETCICETFNNLKEITIISTHKISFKCDDNFLLSTYILKDKLLWFSYNKIRSILEKKFNIIEIKDIELFEVVTSLMKINFNWDIHKIL